MSSDAQGVLRYLHRVLDDPDAQNTGDIELLQRFVTRRDESAFELLMWRHAGMVLSVCRAILRDHHLAEDAFQATFLALARKAGSAGRRGSVAGWLHRVAHNAALKARGRKVRDACQPIAVEPAVPADQSDAEVGLLLHEELGRLPDKYRTPLVLCFLEGQSHADAARVLGWPKGTVSGRFARARELLRQRLIRRAAVMPVALFGTVLTAATSSAAAPALVSATMQAALAFASGNAAAGAVSISVLRLTERVLHAMFLSKLKSAALCLCVLGFVVLSGGLLGGWALAQKPGEEGGSAGSSSAALPPKEPEDPRIGRQLRDKSLNNLKQIGIAVHAFYEGNKEKFPNNVFGPDKKPLLSWRVLLLPYLDQNPLYKEFKLDEPWDSEHNLKLLSKMPDVYRAGTAAKDSTSTYYQGFVHDDAMFPAGKSLSMADVSDGTSNTILLIEAGTAVPWTKPVDLEYADNKPLPKLGGPFAEVIHAAFVDGAAMSIKRKFDEKQMRLAITRNDGQPQTALNLRADVPPPVRKPLRKENDREALERAAAEAAAQRDLAAREAARAAEAARELQLMAALRQKEIAAIRAEADRAREHAEEARLQSVRVMEENKKLKDALREVANQLNKLLPAEAFEAKPGPAEVKALAAELARTQAELRRLRDEVERLEESAGEVSALAEHLSACMTGLQGLP